MGKKSLKNTIFWSIFIVSGTLLIVFSLSIAVVVYKSGVDNAIAIIRQRNLAMKNYILGYFMPMRRTVEVFSENPILKKGTAITQEEKQQILNFYRTVKDVIPNINYIYSGYEDKSLFINDYEPPEGFDPRVRPWYRKAIESHPYISDGIPYQEIKYKTWLVSISRTITDKKGKILGVLAVDTALDDVANQLRLGDRSLKTSYSYVINRKNVVIIHHEHNFLGRTLNELITPAPDFTKNEGRFEYKISGTEKIAYYNRIDELGWILVTVVNKSEILLPLFMRIAIILGVALMAAMLSGNFISNVLIKSIVSPLVDLENYLKGNMESDSLTEQIPYPDNEIGKLTQAIQGITDAELYKKNQQLMEMNTELEALSITDQLTGLFNRRKMLQEIEREKLRIDRYNCNASIIIFDIDYFKEINDTYGHIEGDTILKELGEVVKSSIRKTDILGRWGGDEFVILLPETDLQSAVYVAEKIRRTVEEHIFSMGRHVTVSIGIAMIKAYSSIEDTLKEADDMLYRAKEKGRNSVEYPNK